MIPCLNHSTIIQCDTEEFIKVSLNAGFSFVELRQAKIEEYLLAHSRDKLLDLMHKLKVKVAAFHVFEGMTLVPKENQMFFLKKAEMMIWVCKLIGCDLLIVGPGNNIAGLKKEDMFEFSVRRLRLISDLAKIHNVEIGFEPVGFMNSSIRKIKDAIEILNLVNKPNIRLVIDNFHLAAGQNEIDDIGEISPDKIAIVHISDFKVKKYAELCDDDRVLIGDGDFPFDEFFRILKDTGYEGLVSVEAFSKKLLGNDPVYTANESFRRLSEYVD